MQAAARLGSEALVILYCGGCLGLSSLNSFLEQDGKGRAPECKVHVTLGGPISNGAEILPASASLTRWEPGSEAMGPVCSSTSYRFGCLAERLGLIYPRTIRAANASFTKQSELNRSSQANFKHLLEVVPITHMMTPEPNPTR